MAAVVRVPVSNPWLIGANQQAGVLGRSPQDPPPDMLGVSPGDTAPGWSLLTLVLWFSWKFQKLLIPCNKFLSTKISLYGSVS